MPHNEQETIPESEILESVGEKRGVASETLKRVMMMASNFDESEVPLNENHITEILSQRREITGYIREDRKAEHEKFKIESWDKKFYFVGGVIVWLVMFLVSMMYYKEQVVTILVATMTFFGGYGFGSQQTKKTKE